MTTMSIRTHADAAALVPVVLGFHPTDSLVVLGTGGGPSARIDLAALANVVDVRAQFSAFVPHLKGHPTLLIAYTGNRELATSAMDLADFILPGVTIGATLRVHDGLVYDLTDPHDTGTPVPGAHAVGAEAAAVNVVGTRDDLVAEAAAVTDLDTCENLAMQSWLAGQGARAWCYHDRAVELRGHESGLMEELAYALTHAIDPRQIRR